MQQSVAASNTKSDFPDAASENHRRWYHHRYLLCTVIVLLMLDFLWLYFIGNPDGDHQFKVEKSFVVTLNKDTTNWKIVGWFDKTEHEPNQFAVTIDQWPLCEAGFWAKTHRWRANDLRVQKMKDVETHPPTAVGITAEQEAELIKRLRVWAQTNSAGAEGASLFEALRTKLVSFHGSHTWTPEYELIWSGYVHDALAIGVVGFAIIVIVMRTLARLGVLKA